MHQLRTRAGLTLVEIQVALVVGAIVSVLAFGALVQLRRVTEGLIRHATAERLGAEVVTLMEALGRQMRYAVVLGDTAIQGEYRIAAGVACHSLSSSVTLAPASVDASDVLTFLADLPNSGDHLEFVVRSHDSGALAWDVRRVVGSVTLSASEGCGIGNPFVAPALHERSVVRMFHDALDSPVLAGVPVEIYRGVRLVVYHAGDMGWVIGLRHCVDGRCGPAQPIVGPVRSPRDAGLRLWASQSTGPITVAVRVPGVERAFVGVIPAVVPVP